MAKLIAFGSNNIDEYYSISHWPKPGDKAVITFHHQEIGGMIGNAASVYGYLGLPATAFDFLPPGDDTNLILSSLIKSNVSTDYIDISSSHELRKCLIYTHEGERIIYVISKSNTVTTLTEKQQTQLEPNTLFYCNPIDFYHLSNNDLVVKKGCQIVFDVEYNAIYQLSEPIKFLSQASYLFINQSAHEYLQSKDPNYLDVLSARTIIITQGEKGSLLYNDGQFVVIEACPTRVVDTTGAGDTHHAAFLYALHKGYDKIRAARFASAAASLSITQMGPRSGQHREAEILSYATAQNYLI